MCDCITQEQYDAIYEHDLNDECQVDSARIDFDHAKVLNVFNFYGPVYGDINAEEDEEAPEIE